MPRRILFALLLVLNHSVLFGASQAAYIPDELHPFGSAFPHEHLHEHGQEEHDPDHGHGHDHDVPAQAADRSLLTPDSAPLADTTVGSDHNHESAHSHGVHIPLNCDLPFSLSLLLNTTQATPPASRQSMQASLACAPPVPPPNV